MSDPVTVAEVVPGDHQVTIPLGARAQELTWALIELTALDPTMRLLNYWPERNQAHLLFRGGAS